MLQQQQQNNIYIDTVMQQQNNNTYIDTVKQQQQQNNNNTYIDTVKQQQQQHLYRPSSAMTAAPNMNSAICSTSF